MGCDIIEHVERRIAGAWEYVDVPADVMILRDYSLFSVLAGVRSDSADPPQRFEPQNNIPADASPQLQYEYGGGEMYYGHSYRTLAELLAHDWSEWPAFVRFLDWMKTLGKPNDIRFVFWFGS